MFPRMKPGAGRSLAPLRGEECRHEARFGVRRRLASLESPRQQGKLPFLWAFWNTVERAKMSNPNLTRLTQLTMAAG